MHSCTPGCANQAPALHPSQTAQTASEALHACCSHHSHATSSPYSIGSGATHTAHTCCLHLAAGAQHTGQPQMDAHSTAQHALLAGPSRIRERIQPDHTFSLQQARNTNGPIASAYAPFPAASSSAVFRRSASLKRASAACRALTSGST